MDLLHSDANEREMLFVEKEGQKHTTITLTVFEDGSMIVHNGNQSGCSFYHYFQNFKEGCGKIQDMFFNWKLLANLKGVNLVKTHCADAKRKN